MAAINSSSGGRPRHRHNRSTRRTRDFASTTTEHHPTGTSFTPDLAITFDGATSTNGQTRNVNRENRSNTRVGAQRNRLPTTMEPQNFSSVSNTTNSPPNLRGNDRGRRHRGRKLPSTRGTSAQSNMNGQRQFGSQLTSGSPREANQIEIAEEVTREISRHRSNEIVTSRTNQQILINSRKCFQKSQAADVATRTHEDIKNGLYECLICTNEILSKSRVWSCKTCWSVLHLSCVKHWADNEASTYKQRNVENSITPSPRKWRCPGCNLPKDDPLTSYTCWCSKECDPSPIAGLPPHSCGQTCSRSRANYCPHPCESICHAGPCAPCNQMGPLLSCFCGGKKRSRKCVDTNYKNGWSCEKICDKLLPCGEHKCRKICHEGKCGDCELLIKSSCYCTKVIRNMPCSKLSTAKESYINGQRFLGFFNCGTKCLRRFDCGNPKHFCEKTCHKQDELPAHCPFSPDVVDFCRCGKTPISELVDEPRKDCSAPIPHCGKICEKLLPCGHLCKQKCHRGKCGFCREVTEISCQCGRITSETLCHQGDEQKPCCPRVCRSILNCGRHECSSRCCPGEKKASERQASRRKNRAFHHASSNANNYEPEHICLKVCGRTLKCGNHTCSALCHKGPCPSCIEAIFDEISCSCGRTTLQPPQPCGTVAPQCHFDCTRPRTCGHSMIKHQCHPDTVPCLKCPFLMQKPCICGKKYLKNQPCWFSETRCGLICGKKLKCGIHDCQKSCHRDGQCEDTNIPCNQPCGRKRTVCEHSCLSQCHAPYPCKETQPCQAKIYITCTCGNQKQLMKCLASKSFSGNSVKGLACNDECLKLQRNSNIADAFKIDQKTHQDDHIPYSTKTILLYSKDTKFGKTYEEELLVFAKNENMKILRFKPMAPHQRAFIHSLAEDFGLCSESLDVEPHRFVSIIKSPRFVSAPAKKLSQCVSEKKQIQNSDSNFTIKNLKQKENWNAILLTTPRFGLTTNEIQKGLGCELIGNGYKFEVLFLPTQEFLLRFVPEHKLENIQETLMKKKLIFTKLAIDFNLSENTTLCLVDDNLRILKRATMKIESQGWNQVAKGARNNKKLDATGLGKKNSFTVLGSLKKNKVEKLPVEDPPDDWEEEVDKSN